jgi:transcriptional regulator with XRE-family HTH domain
MKMWERFDQELKAKGLTQAQLEVDLGLAENRISKWKDKPENFSILDAADLARAIGVTLSYLVDDDATPPEPVPVIERELTPAEQAVVGVFRISRLSVADAAGRLMPPPPKRSPRKRRQG